MNRRQFVASTAGSVAPGLASIAAPSTRPPNILFLFPDQLRHDFIEPSPGIPVRTPVLKRLAGSGVRFTQSVTPAPLCAPARACLASGMEYDHCRVPTNAQNYPLDQPTFYQSLRKAGYHVMGCGKFDLHKPELDWGLDGKRMINEWGFSDGTDNEGKHDATRAYTRAGKPMGPFMAHLDRLGLAKAHVADYERRKSKDATFTTPLPDAAYGDNWIGQNGLTLLDSAPRGKPWFLQVNFNGPHDPWDITARMEKGWRGISFPQPVRNTQFPPAAHELIRQNYAAMIENIDRLCGLLIDKVRQRGELSNTIIAFSSDHGEMLGDHNLWSKRQPYHGSVGVPMILSGPGIRGGVVNRSPATTLDLTSTFLDYAGIGRPNQMQSRSLRPLLSGLESAARPYVLSGMDKWRLVIEERYKYVRGYGERPMLFDLEKDPQEIEDLASSKPDAAARMGRILDSV